MKKLVSFLLVPLFILFSGCSDDEKEEAKKDTVKTFEEEKAEAMSSMETVFASMSAANITDPVQLGNFDFNSPRKLFDALKLKRPDDREVRVSLAMCQMLSLYRNPVFKSFLQDMNANGILKVPNSDFSFSLGFLPFNMMSVLSQEMILNSMALMVKKGTENPDATAAQQKEFVTVILPQISEAIANFEYVEAQSNPFREYQYALTGKMMGFPGLPSQYLDNTEFYMMDSYLEYLQATLSLYCIIDFQKSDFSEVQIDSLDLSLLPLLEGRIVLRQDGQHFAELFVKGMEKTANDIVSALTYLQFETDNQNDDVIKKNPNLTVAEIFKLVQQVQAGRDQLLGLIEKWLPLLQNLPTLFPSNG